MKQNSLYFSSHFFPVIKITVEINEIDNKKIEKNQWNKVGALKNEQNWQNLG